MDEKLEVEIQALTRKAAKKLEAARKNLEFGFYDDAISRAYYACFHAAQAMLLTQNLRAKSHKGVKNLFGLHLVQSGKVEREYALDLDSLRSSRENGDYEVFIELTQQDASKALATAEKFVLRAQRFLKA